MPYQRLLFAEPPHVQQMDQWEREGWSRVQVLGPCPVMDVNTKQPKTVYVVYMWRSIIAGVPPPPLGGGGIGPN